MRFRDGLKFKKLMTQSFVPNENLISEIPLNRRFWGKHWGALEQLLGALGTTGKL